MASPPCPLKGQWEARIAPGGAGPGPRKGGRGGGGGASQATGKRPPFRREPSKKAAVTLTVGTLTVAPPPLCARWALGTIVLQELLWRKAQHSLSFLHSNEVTGDSADPPLQSRSTLHPLGGRHHPHSWG